MNTFWISFVACNNLGITIKCGKKLSSQIDLFYNFFKFNTSFRCEILSMSKDIKILRIYLY